MEDNQECQFDEATNEQVKKFAHGICNWIYERFPDYGIELAEDIAFNSDHTQSAMEMSISTDLGVVIVLPDFKNMSAAAVVLNLGIVQAMMKEGFEIDYIEKNGDIYSNPIAFTDSTVEVLGYYLTHRLNLIK